LEQPIKQIRTNKKMQKLLIYVLGLIVLASALQYSGIIEKKENFKLCLQNPPFAPESIEIEPKQPYPGVLLTTTTKGMATQETPVTGGTIYMPVIFKNITVFEYKYDLCEVTVGGCPIRKGPTMIVIKQQTPRFAFPGIYTAIPRTVEAVTGRNLSCVEFQFEVIRRP
jgi:hypothetical protein